MFNNMMVMEELQKVQKLAEADAAGDPSAHPKLLEAIRGLQLAAETPVETTSRLNFQVGFRGLPGQSAIRKEKPATVQIHPADATDRLCKIYASA